MWNSWGSAARYQMVGLVCVLGGCSLSTQGLGPIDGEGPQAPVVTDQSGLLPDPDGAVVDQDDAATVSPSLDGGTTSCREGTQHCEANRVEECTAGHWQLVETCPASCSTERSGKCATLVPSNSDGSLTGTAETIIDSATTFDTTACSGSLGSASVATQSSGMPELCVVQVRSLEVTPTGYLRITGSRGLVIVATERIDIGGILDASGRVESGVAVPGPGGGRGALPGQSAAGPSPGTSGSHEGDYADGGGGGGGMSGRGGAGGLADESAGGDGGSSQAMAAWMTSLSPLAGGSGGGFGNGGASQFGAGGAGGGALQLSAGVAILVGRSSHVYVAGSGGLGGLGTDGNRGAGGGGGSGGSLLLEAATITVEERGSLVAAGGGGGGGGHFPSGDGSNGQDGNLTETRASGGVSGGGGDGNGGTSGGADQLNGLPGGESHASNGNGGGGGGAAGCILLRGTSIQVASSASTSPTLSPGYRTALPTYR